MAVCGPGDFQSRLLDWEFVQAFTCQFADSIGFLALGMLVYGFLGMAIYAYTGSVLIPLVLLFLTGGAIMTQTAGIATTIATVIVLVAGAGVVTLIYVRYSR